MPLFIKIIKWNIKLSTRQFNKLKSRYAIFLQFTIISSFLSMLIKLHASLWWHLIEFNMCLWVNNFNNNFYVTPSTYYWGNHIRENAPEPARKKALKNISNRLREENSSTLTECLQNTGFEEIKGLNLRKVLNKGHHTTHVIFFCHSHSHDDVFVNFKFVLTQTYQYVTITFPHDSHKIHESMDRASIFDKYTEKNK